MLEARGESQILNIDKMLKEANWSIQHFEEMNLGPSLGVAVREFPLSKDHTDYSLS